jgi:hypothetical protein
VILKASDQIILERLFFQTGNDKFLNIISKFSVVYLKSYRRLLKILLLTFNGWVSKRRVSGCMQIEFVETWICELLSQSNKYLYTSRIFSSYQKHDIFSICMFIMYSEVRQKHRVSDSFFYLVIF